MTPNFPSPLGHIHGRTQRFLSDAEPRPSLIVNGSSDHVARLPAVVNDMNDANALNEPILEVGGATAADSAGASALIGMSEVANALEESLPGDGFQRAANPKVCPPCAPPAPPQVMYAPLNPNSVLNKS